MAAGYAQAGGGRGRPAPAVPVLSGVDVELRAGECLAVVGRSGCGKSTLLHVLAGLMPPLAGTVWVDGRVVGAAEWHGTVEPGCSPGHAAYMFQRDLLLPWKTAVHNAMFAAEMAARSRGSRVRGTPVRRRRGSADPSGLERRARALLEEFGLGDALEAIPSELSGGMRQRVALARTVLMDRGLILLDEPFGSLDAVTRAEMRCWLLEVMTAHPATWVLVTHDVEEAVLLGDRVAVLRGRPGRIEGWETPGASRRERLTLARASGVTGGGHPRLAPHAASVGRKLMAEAAADPHSRAAFVAAAAAS